jgi:uncharacterized membrane protein
MADVRLIRLAWKKGASANPQEAGDWLPYTQQAQWLLQSLADARCAAFGAGTHWVEERVEAEAAPEEITADTDEQANALDTVRIVE